MPDEMQWCRFCSTGNTTVWVQGGEAWCWNCGTYLSGEGNHLGLTAEEAIERATVPEVWLHQMVHGPKAKMPG